MADAPALDLEWRSDAGASLLTELLHAALDDCSPLAIHEHETGDGWRVFFRTAADRDRAAALLAASPELSGQVTISPIAVVDEDWARRSQANITAVQVGRIVVAPPWDARSAAAGELLIVIDPSTGFGTGHHETTRLCLSLLQSIGVAGSRAIDVGTGSGVLAIAAARLGATAVTALDDDAEALRNAEENVVRNGVADVVSLQQADLATYASAPAAIVTANLTGAVLQRYAAQLTALVDTGGALIISGFNTGELDDVAGAFDLAVEREAAEGAWSAAVLRLSPAAARK